MSKHSACPIECTLLQLFHLIDIISLIVIAVIDSFHINNLLYFFLEHQVESYAHASAIPFSERMGNIHRSYASCKIIYFTKKHSVNLRECFERPRC